MVAYLTIFWLKFLCDFSYKLLPASKNPLTATTTQIMLPT